MQSPERDPGEFGPGRHLRRVIGFWDEVGSIGLFFGQVGQPLCGYAVSELPAERRREFFAASSTNSASLCMIFCPAYRM